MILENTADMMLSEDYKDRFKAEYCQVCIRYEKLNQMLHNWDQLSFTPNCSYDLLNTQASIMSAYINVLRERARLENIDLPSDFTY